MAHRRERHGRGLRGPLSLPNRLTGSAVPLRQRPARAAFFVQAVHAAVAKVHDECPRALHGVDIGIEDVPSGEGPWARDRVPLASAISGVPGRAGQVVLYRRPLERRAQSRKGLRILVYRTLIEQLAALTGIPPGELDPNGYGRDDDWD